MFRRTDRTLRSRTLFGCTSLARAALLMLLLWGAAPSLRAIDPLPADVEQASPEVKSRYLEALARQSLEEKLKVGRQRYQDRVQLRQALHHHMMAEVEARQAEISGSNGVASHHSGFLSFLKPTAIVVGCGIGVILMVQAWRRTALA